MQGGLIGERLKTQDHMGPGPADYDNNGLVIKSSARRVIIDKSERQDNWVEQEEADKPGPANYDA